MRAVEVASLPLETAHSGISKADYLRIRDQLVFTRSFGPTLGILGMDALLLACAAQLLARNETLPFLLSQLLLAVVCFNAFSILHECSHGTASNSRLLNALVGLVASTLCFIPYYPWKYIHQTHHAWTGNLERDPVAKSVRSWRDRSVPWIVRVAWWSWIPLGALLQHLVYLMHPVTMWRQGEITCPKLLKLTLSIVWLPAAWWGVWTAAPELVRFENWALGFGLFLIAEELVNLPHHMDVLTTRGDKLAIWEQHRTTRSCYYPPLLAELLVLNFNFHTEHHLFPNLPWFRLRGARALVKGALGPSYLETVGIGWNLRNRTRDLQRIIDRYRAIGRAGTSRA